MMHEEIEAICNICRDTFWVEKNPLTDLMDKIVGVCMDCHESYINGNRHPSREKSVPYSRLTDLA